MTTRNEPSPLYISLLKELLEAHHGPIREELRALKHDLRIDVAAIRSDVVKNRDDLAVRIDDVEEVAAHAHKRIDKHENRFFGWICGAAGIGTAAGGFTVSGGAKDLLKYLLS